MGYDKKPLYRRVNTKARGVHHHFGEDASDTRSRRKGSKRGSVRLGMNQGVQRGLDYTPLFRFLLSRVGDDWSAVHSEAVSRLDKQEPISWIVATNPLDEKAFVGSGESTYWSGLKVGADGQLALVDPNFTATDAPVYCTCCTHTFNGEVYGREEQAAMRSES